MKIERLENKNSTELGYLNRGDCFIFLNDDNTIPAESHLWLVTDTGYLNLNTAYTKAFHNMDINTKVILIDNATLTWIL